MSAVKHGGAREGAGRPAKAKKYATPIADAEDRIADKLPQIVDHLEKVAFGGFTIINKKFVLARTLKHKAKNGEDVPLFPDAKPDEMVCVEETHLTQLPDRQALEYLWDRLAGKPMNKHEFANVSDEELRAAILAEAAADARGSG